MAKQNKTKSDAGFSLVEVLVALVILALAGAALVQLLQGSTQQSRGISTKTVALSGLESEVAAYDGAKYIACDGTSANPYAVGKNANTDVTIETFLNYKYTDGSGKTIQINEWVPCLDTPPGSGKIALAFSRANYKPTVQRIHLAQDVAKQTGNTNAATTELSTRVYRDIIKTSRPRNADGSFNGGGVICKIASNITFSGGSYQLGVNNPGSANMALTALATSGNGTDPCPTPNSSLIFNVVSSGIPADWDAKVVGSTLTVTSTRRTLPAYPLTRAAVLTIEGYDTDTNFLLQQASVLVTVTFPKPVITAFIVKDKFGNVRDCPDYVAALPNTPADGVCGVKDDVVTVSGDYLLGNPDDIKVNPLTVMFNGVEVPAANFKPLLPGSTTSYYPYSDSAISFKVPGNVANTSNTEGHTFTVETQGGIDTTPYEYFSIPTPIVDDAGGSYTTAKAIDAGVSDVVTAGYHPWGSGNTNQVTFQGYNFTTANLLEFTCISGTGCVDGRVPGFINTRALTSSNTSLCTGSNGSSSSQSSWSRTNRTNTSVSIRNRPANVTTAPTTFAWVTSSSRYSNSSTILNFDNQITTCVPASAIAGKVYVTNAAGDGTSVFNFHPEPVIVDFISRSSNNNNNNNGEYGDNYFGPGSGSANGSAGNSIDGAGAGVDISVIGTGLKNVKSVKFGAGAVQTYSSSGSCKVFCDSASENEIRLAVPTTTANAKDGVMTVTSGTTNYTSLLNFYVTPRVKSITVNVNNQDVVTSTPNMGQVITLNGTGFTGLSPSSSTGGVKINSVNATATNTSDNSLDVAISCSITTGQSLPILVTTGLGSSTGTPKSITVSANFTPVITGVGTNSSGTDGTWLSGSTVKVSGSGLACAKFVKWNNQALAVSSATDTLATTSSSSSPNGKLSSTAPTDCSPTVSVSSNAVSTNNSGDYVSNFTLTPKPTVTKFSVGSASSIVKGSTQVTLTGTNFCTDTNNIKIYLQKYTTSVNNNGNKSGSALTISGSDITNKSSTSLTFVIPSSLASGSYQISVQNGTQSAVSAKNSCSSCGSIALRSPLVRNTPIALTFKSLYSNFIVLAGQLLDISNTSNSSNSNYNEGENLPILSSNSGSSSASVTSPSTSTSTSSLSASTSANIDQLYLVVP